MIDKLKLSYEAAVESDTSPIKFPTKEFNSFACHAYNNMPEIIRQLEQSERMREAFEWLAENSSHQLSYDGFEDDEWRVHRVDGPRSDREWTLVATGDTPLEAIRAAISQAKGEP